MENIKVQKKGGKAEPWVYDKLLASIGKTGIALDVAESITNKVETWVKVNSKNDVINSDDVRDKVIELLKEADPAAGDTYQAYKAE